MDGGDRLALADMRELDMQGGGDGVIAAKGRAGRQAGSIVLGTVLKKGRYAEIGPRGCIVAILGKARIGAQGETERLEAIAFDQRIGFGSGDGADKAGKDRGGGRPVGGGGCRHQDLVIQQDCLRPGLGVEELHSMIEIGILESRSSAIHCAGGSRRDVDDGKLRRCQPRAVGRLVGRVLRHDLEGIAILAEEDGDRPRGDQHAPATDGDKEIGIGFARGIPGGADVGIGAILFDLIEDAGKNRPQGLFDAADNVGSPVDGR